MTSEPANAVAPPRRRRRWLRAFVALALGFVFTAVLVEIAFRCFWTMPPWFAEFAQAGMYVASPSGGVALTPGYRGTLQIGADAATTVVINELGLRGPAVAAKTAGERRVLMAGDSLVFGYGVEANDSLPAAVERELRSRSLVATVGNAGIPSFGVGHSVGRMAELDAPFATDVFVVCGFLGNDAIDDVLSLRVVDAGLLHQGTMAKLVRTSWRTRLALRSRAWLWLEAWIAVNAPERSPLHQVTPDPLDAARTAGLPPNAQQHAGLFLDVADRETTWQPGTAPVLPRLLGYLREALVKAKATAGARPLVFVVLPTSWQVDETKRVQHLRELGFDPALYTRGVAQQRWLAVAADLGITAVDATSILAAENDAASLYLADGGHFSVRGNEVVGKWLAEQLVPLLR